MDLRIVDEVQFFIDHDRSLHKQPGCAHQSMERAVVSLLFNEPRPFNCFLTIDEVTEQVKRGKESKEEMDLQELREVVLDDDESTAGSGLRGGAAGGASPGPARPPDGRRGREVRCG
jgi:hypothetical protein